MSASARSGKLRSSAHQPCWEIDVLKTVIFDIDGTLLDSVDVHAEAWVRTFAHFGVNADFADVRSHIGEGGDRLMPAFLGDAAPDAQQDEIQRYRTDLFKREYLSNIRAFPKVRELFERIRADGRSVVLASSCSREEIGRYKELADISDLVDGEVTADDARSSKPAPDIFLKALESIAPVTAAQAIVIGDTRYDGQAARKAGILFVALLCGGSPERELRNSGCIAVFRDPADLLASYDKSPIGTGR
jgi:HAD superfamily hydrolase (TIGR01549 family)